MKLLMWLLLGLLVYWAWRAHVKKQQAKFRQQHVPPAAPTGGSTQPSAKPSTPIENMVACTYCQIYLPASEAIRVSTGSKEHYFCSEEHAKLYEKAAAKAPDN